MPIEADNVINEEFINFGIVTFDNLGIALIAIFQMVTLEGWTGVMYNLSDASQPWMAVIFCCLLVIIGAFFLL